MGSGGGRFNSGRHAGVLVPLFSIPSRRSWGIGELPDLVPFARWLESAGFDFVQFLPLNEMQEGQSSPYSALSAMAIDPIFIAVENVDDWIAAGCVLDHRAGLGTASLPLGRCRRRRLQLVARAHPALVRPL